MLSVFLVEKDSAAAMSLMLKLTGVRHRQMIPVSKEEMRAWKSGKIYPIILPDYTPHKTFIEDRLLLEKLQEFLASE